MSTRLLALVAALALAAPAAYARASDDIHEFLRTMALRAEARVSAAGVRLDATTVKVRAHVGVDGRLTGPYVVKSSGSTSTDTAVEAALKRMPVYAPAGLTGRSITLTLGRGRLAQIDPQPASIPQTGTRIVPKSRAAPPLILRPDAGYLPSTLSSSPIRGTPS